MIDERVVSGRFERSFEPTHAAASQLRHELADLLRSAGVPARSIGDFELVLSELASNAVDQEPARPVEVELLVGRDGLHLTVTNSRGDDEPLELPTAKDADLLAERGRGLSIVDAVVDGMWVHGGSSTTSVSCMMKHPGHR